MNGYILPSCAHRNNARIASVLGIGTEIVIDTRYTPERVMVIAAHPDDAEFGSAGTIAKWVKEGATAAYILATSGDVGIDTLGMTKQRAAEIREAESIAAASVVGVEEVIFLREPDGMLQNTMDLRRRLVREIRRFKPEVVITGDPTMFFTPRGGVNHPDHRAIDEAALDAIFPAAGQPNLFQELETQGLQAHKVRKLYLTARGQGDVFVDITDTIELKIQALQKHVSQVGGWEELPERIRAWSAEIAAGKDMTYAEAYRVIILESDATWEMLQRRGKE
jgi:LmbE family N-acetylglucosaminyl deacetylase